MCPNCNKSLIPYVYGYPSDAIFDLEKEGKIKWSGIYIYESNSPDSWCGQCDGVFVARAYID